MIDGKDFLQRMRDDIACAEESQAAAVAIDAAMGAEQTETLAKAAPVTFTKLTRDQVERPRAFPVIQPALNDDILAQVDDITPALNKVFADTDLEIQFPGLLELSSGNEEVERNFRKLHGLSEDTSAPFVRVRSTPELRKAARESESLSGEGVYQGRKYQWQLAGSGDDEHIEARWI